MQKLKIRRSNFGRKDSLITMHQQPSFNGAVVVAQLKNVNQWGMLFHNQFVLR